MTFIKFYNRLPTRYVIAQTSSNRLVTFDAPKNLNQPTIISVCENLNLTDLTYIGALADNGCVIKSIQIMPNYVTDETIFNTYTNHPSTLTTLTR